MKYLLLLALSFLWFAANAQNSISGKITDSETGVPLFHAGVYISDLKKGAITDSLGAFEITNLPIGKYLLTANFAGYNSQNIAVVIQGETQVHIALDPAHMEVQEIVVTGVSHATELKKSPIPTVVIGKDELARSTATNVVDAISKVPGVSQLSTGTAISKPIIRGLGYTRVITLYDGVRQEGQQWGDEHGIEVDQFSVQRIEILKGPASFMYGSDALGGVVNLLGESPKPEGISGGDLRTEFQTNSRLYAISSSYGGNKNGVNWLGRITRKQAGNYANAYDGRVHNSGFVENAASGYIGLNKSWGYSHIAFTAFDQVVGLVEGERDSATGRFIREVKTNDTLAESIIVPDDELNSYDISVPRQHITHYRIYATNNFIIGKNRLNLNAGFQNNIRRELGEALSPDEPNIRLDLKTTTADAKYFFSEYKGWDAALGINGMYQFNKAGGEEYIIPEYNLWDAGAFAFVKRSFEKLDLSGGVRFDYRTINADAMHLKNGIRVPNPDALTETKFSAFSRSYKNISGSMGATYSLGKNMFLKANIARGFRSPSIAELSSNGVHEGTFRYEIGNPDLKAETSLQGDLGLYLDSRHISLETALFNNDIANYIHLEKIANSQGGDSIIDPAEPLAAAYRFVQGKARLYGAEAGIDIHPHPFDWLHFENTVAVVYGLNKTAQTEDAKYLPFIPAANTRSELRADINALSKKLGLKGSYVKVEAQHYFSQERIYKVGNTETSTPGYTLINAGIGTSFLNKKGRPFLDFTVTANNLTDVAYQNHLSRLKYAGENQLTGRTGVYNMGRNFSFLLNFLF